MATLLHLSDLHLGDEDYAVFADHKVEVIDPAARQGRSNALANTLRALGEALLNAGEEIDAVVISGDVTYQANPAGFAMLPKMLANLGEALPDRSRIMVVPGNHDVEWNTRPGSAERYKNFIDGVRDQGYVTPLLEGIDVDHEGSRLTRSSPVLTASDGTFVLVALNSSDHCGVRELIDAKLEADIAAVEADTSNSPAQSLLSAWRRSTLYDIARVSSEQRTSARAALVSAGGGASDLLRIAVLHHQLLPISLEEEIKPFESIVNLSQVRDWLARNDVDIVLHGHKHVAVTYEDRYVPLDGQNAMAHRLVVSSVGTVGQGQPAENVVGRLITIEPKRRSVGRATIRDVLSVNPGVPIALNALRTTVCRTRVDTPTSSHVIEGRHSRDVHEQILDLTDDGLPLPKPLVCRVLDPRGAQKVPGSYEGLRFVPEDENWFDDLVSLWQARPCIKAMPFNHGERIFDLEGANQFDRAINALVTREASSRAVISVFSPRLDNIADDDQDFPAFCLVHLLIVDDELQVIAYFRKQEMRYWWGVNLAELGRLQQTAVERINARRGNSTLHAGEITTITAIPISGDHIPRVAVPQVDRWVDQEPGRLLRMALLPFQPAMAESPAALADWKLLVEESHLPEATAADGSPVPVLGLLQIRNHLIALKLSFGEMDLVTELVVALQLAASANKRYRAHARSFGANAEDRDAVIDGHAAIAARVEELEKSLKGHENVAGASDASASKPPSEGGGR